MEISENEKYSNNKLEKEQQKNEVSIKQAIINIREEINEIKAKKAIAKINKS